MAIAESELVLNSDGSVYHIKLKPEHIADNVIIVGDPHRVEMISNYFDEIEVKISNREFTTHTGVKGNTRITVMSTGIGTDNIDIVINELDAAVNIDLETREIKEVHKSLNIVRLGTSGALQADIEVDSFVLSEYGLGLDGMLHYYDYPNDLIEQSMTGAFIKQTEWGTQLPRPYIVKASESLMDKLGDGMARGITATAPGFYGPQGRILRLPVRHPNQNESFTNFNFEGSRITNYEMETSALYGLGRMLGHNTCTICTIIANRLAKKYSEDYQISVDKMIRLVLDRLAVENK